MSAEPSSSRRSSARSRKSGVVTPHDPSLLQRFGAWVLFAVISVIHWTMRYKWVDQAGYFETASDQRSIYCVWHNRLALCLPIYRKFAQTRSRSPGMAAMASASRDGAFLAAVIAHFGAHPVRGSSSRRGHQALLELTGWAERGYDLAITPDGPRGPKYVVQDGVVGLSQVTGLPILPSTFNYSWKIKVKSWDGFQVPLPFSRCDVLIGAPVRIPRDASDEQRESARLLIETTLKSLSRD